MVAAVIFAETGLLFGFFLPGDSLLFTAGIFCGTGLLKVDIYTFLAVISLAAILGDSTGYAIGRKMGKALFARKESFLFKPKHVEMTKAFYERHGGKAIVLGRFVPIIRTFAPVMAGVAELKYREFLIYNITGGIAWVLLMTVSGYYLGGFEFVRRHLEPIVVGIILLSLVPVVRTFLQERKRSRNTGEKSSDSK